MTKARTDNRRLAQWREKWLIEHSTSHQLLWCIDSLVLRNPARTPSGRTLAAIQLTRQFFDRQFVQTIKPKHKRQ
jgi:hypothetical protein